MRNHYYKYLLCILLTVACGLFVILAVLSNNNSGSEKRRHDLHARAGGYFNLLG